MRRNIKIVISYDGTDYAGWQVQSNDPSIQGAIETALSDLHGVPVSLTGAGRTDSGVHASGQVGNFNTDKDNIPGEKFRDALNARLPGDIRILSSIEVPEFFHSRRDAVERQYEYRMFDGGICPAHMKRFTWQLRRLPPLKDLNEIASVICGTHDFSTFSAAGDVSRSKIRRINHAVFISDGPVTLFRINGNAFLWRMVRSLLGTMIDLGIRGGGAEGMRGILESRNRLNAGPTAKAHGLFLTKVKYGQGTNIH